MARRRVTHPAHAAGVAAYRQLEEALDEGTADGCEDCTVRVILEAAAPLLEQEARAELLVELEQLGRLRDTPGED